MNSNTRQSCYHCGLDIPDGIQLDVKVLGNKQAMCCAGCKAVAEAIVAAGQSSYYENRTEFSSRGRELVPDFLKDLKVYDNQQIQKSFVRETQAGFREASLLLEGISCAACVWLNEKHIAQQPGVISVQINYATHRATVAWDNDVIALSDILASIRTIGYVAHPYDPDQQHVLLQKESKAQLRRIGVAGIMGMQIMVISVALYLGDWTGINSRYRALFQWAGLLLVLPILLYSAKPFYSAAVRDLKSANLGMDVPVALGISIAFLGSVYTTLTGQGEVYYDSVAMFVFFLLTARYFEFRARENSADVNERLTRVTPSNARRLDIVTGEYEAVAVAVVELKPQDMIKVYAGEVIPVDGVIEQGISGVNESLLTGESLPRLCNIGDQVIGGSINADSPLYIRVSAVGQDTVLSNLLNLMEKAQGEKPAIAILANRIAAWFVSLILIVAIIAGLSWYLSGNQSWLAIVISLLVVTCPCALSLATPVAITASTGALAKTGMIITGGTVIEALTRVTDFVFDKTGTLTDGNLDLLRLQNYSDRTDKELIQLAAVLERDSEHLLGQALVRYAKESSIDYQSCKTHSVQNFPGQGVSAVIDDCEYLIGNLEFVRTNSNVKFSNQRLSDLSKDGASLVFLTQKQDVLGVFLLGDELRAGAKELIHGLKLSGITTHVYTGDTKEAAYRIANSIELDEVRYKMTPENKLNNMQSIQNANGKVAMIGDGINDALILAGADVSIAMGSAAGLAKLNADVVLTSNSLSVLASGLQHARKTLTIIHQNLAWALLYNILAIPAAAAGYVAPWMAAIGMSLSSLLVVFNSSRLRKTTLNKGSP